MHDPALVGRGQAGADLPRNLEPAILRKASDAAEERREVLAVHVLHREERVAVDFVDVVDTADVRVRDLAGHPHFGVELGQARRIAVDVSGQELQRDRLPELQIVGPKHLAHAAASEAPDDAVAAAEEGAGGKAPVIDAAARGGEHPALLAAERDDELEAGAGRWRRAGGS